MALPPPINGTEEYLAALLGELRGLRGEIRELINVVQAAPAELTDLGDVVELREPEPTPLPEDFPGGAALREAGYVTVEAVPRYTKQLLAIPGIGKATAEAIRQAME